MATLAELMAQQQMMLDTRARGAQPVGPTARAVARPAAPATGIIPGAPVNPVVRTQYAGGPTARPAVAPAPVLTPLQNIGAGARNLAITGGMRTLNAPRDLVLGAVGTGADALRNSAATALGGTVANPTAARDALTQPEVPLVGGEQLRTGLLGLLGATPTPAAAAPKPATAAPTPTTAAPSLQSVIDANRAANPVGQVRAPTTGAAVPTVRGSSFDITNTSRTTGAGRGGVVNPNVNYASIDIPASLAAPQFGAGVPAEEAGGPEVFVIGDSATDPTDPTSRAFDPRAAQLALRQQALEVERANALTDAAARRDVADVSAGAELARTQLAGQFGLQERSLANAGELARADLTGQYGVDAANVKAQQAVQLEAFKARAKQELDSLNPANADDMARAAQIQLQVQLATAALQRDPTNLERAHALSASGQIGNPTILTDALGNPIGTVGSSGVSTEAGTIAQRMAELEALRKRNAEL